ncbi:MULTISPECIES: sirohydrochlorin chelatase [Streptomyces]|uniref:Sirohydrochlorin ferrochelatase n=1 Tax=Streptomyces yunnanensis TaxID=156453 RepID=A0A9X8MIC6_9ACTN|nr:MULTISPECIES: CbiX/SirB N-terminal domain-containing protein [Streptomyces]SHK72794.1 Sirohydrochlorin ferrochelatase [Streptomyces yunnanensis]
MTASTANQPAPEPSPATSPQVPGPHPAPCAPVGAAGLAAEITAELSNRLRTVRLHARRRPAAPPPALVAVAHGSRHPGAAPTVRALLAEIRALRPDLPVRLGHIELDRPLLADTLAGLRDEGIGEVVLVPLLFGRGHHVTHDLPAALAAAPHLSGLIAAPLGPHALLAEALHGRLQEAGFPARPHDTGRPAVVLAAAGSRAPRSALDTARTADLLSARLGGVPVLPAFASAAAPTVPDAVRALADRGHHPRDIAVAACFAAPGRFADRCAALAPGPAAAPLGDHPALARLVLHRYDQALRARTGSRTEGPWPARRTRVTAGTAPSGTAPRRVAAPSR